MRGNGLKRRNVPQLDDQSLDQALWVCLMLLLLEYSTPKALSMNFNLSCGHFGLLGRQCWVFWDINMALSLPFGPNRQGASGLNLQ